MIYIILNYVFHVYHHGQINLLKGIGGVKGLFFILFNLVITKLQDAFYRF